MDCYECARAGNTTVAVALCRGCFAGLCEEHLVETAIDLDRRLYATCNHGTWRVTPTRRKGTRRGYASRSLRRSLRRRPAAREHTARPRQESAMRDERLADHAGVRHQSNTLFLQSDRGECEQPSIRIRT